MSDNLLVIICKTFDTHYSVVSIQSFSLDKHNIMTSINLAVISAEDLALHLLRDRFDGSELSTTQFLLESISALPNAESISEQLLLHASDAVAADEEEESNAMVEQSNEDANSSCTSSLGDSLLLEAESVEIMCIQPRSKFNVSFFEKGMQFQDRKDDSITILSKMIQYVVFFPKPEDCRIKGKKSVSDIVLLVLRGDVAYKNKKILQVCLQLPLESPSWKNDDLSRAKDATALWMQLLVASLDFSIDAVTRVYNPTTNINNKNNKNAFSSHTDHATSTTVSGMPFVSCYYGVNDGVLFPLSTGLLFFKPPLFLHRSTLHSIDCTTGSNRYLTLSVVVTNNNESTSDDEMTMEFTNIHKQEQDVLHQYIHNTLIPAMQRDIDKDVKNATAKRAQEDDERLEEGAALAAIAETNGTAHVKNHKKRKASAEAAIAYQRIPTHQDVEVESDDDDEDYTLKEDDDDDDKKYDGSDTDDGEEESDNRSDNDVVEEDCDAHATESEEDDD